MRTAQIRGRPGAAAAAPMERAPSDASDVRIESRSLVSAMVGEHMSRSAFISSDDITTEGIDQRLEWKRRIDAVV